MYNTYYCKKLETEWSKDEAVDLVASYLKRGEWAPLLTMWLGAVTSSKKKVLIGIYKLYCG